jgi:PAS domain S-box-containing protein
VIELPEPGEELGKFREVNEEACKTFGYTQEELLEMTPYENLVTPRNMLDPILNELRLKKSTLFQSEHITKDGTPISLEVSARVVPLDGQSYVVGIARDITERNLLQKNLQASKNQFKKVLQNSPIPMMVHDSKGRILYLSRSWTEVTGYAKHDTPTLGDFSRKAFQRAGPYKTALPKKKDNQTIKDYLHPLGPKRDQSFEALILTKSKKERTLLFRENLMGDTFSNETLYVCSAIDITESKMAETALIEADQHKDHFLAMLGHELRNPLAAIQNAVEVLNLEPQRESAIDQARGILNRQVHQVSSLLEGLIDSNRIARGEIKLKNELFDLAELVKTVSQDHGYRLNPEEGHLLVDTPDKPCYVLGDRTRFTQIIDNVVSNATKFLNPRGTIWVILESMKKNKKPVYKLTITDTGPGIPVSAQKHLFKPFHQAKQSIDRSKGGLGLGLAVTKGLVDLHKGRISYQSPVFEDYGCSFMIEVPGVIQTQSSKEGSTMTKTSFLEEEKQYAHLPPVLIVEDNEDAAESFSLIIELLGYNSLKAHNAEEGLKLIEEEKPLMTFCDIGLPGTMSGYDFARKLKSTDELKDIPLYAISGYGRTSDRNKAKDAGFDRYLIKPLTLKDIKGLIENFHQHKTGYHQINPELYGP